MPAGPASRVASAAFVAQFVVLDLAASALTVSQGPRLLLGALTSVLFWTLCASFSERRASRGAVSLAAAVDLSVRILFLRYYHGRIDLQVVLSAYHAWTDVRPVLMRVLPALMGAVCVVGFLEYALLSVSRVRGSRPLAVALAVAVLASIASESMKAAARRTSSPAARSGPPASVPLLEPTRAVMPSVLVILTESVRASDYCSGGGSACVVAPEVAALLPDRTELREMRAIASYTAPSISAILTGQPPVGTEKQIREAPGLFEFFRAIRVRGRAPRLVYWSSQTNSLFEGRDVRSKIDSFVTVETLVGHPVGDLEEVVDLGVDRMLAAHVAREMPRLPTPFVSVLHFQGTHAPYFVDEARAPFRPFSHVAAWSGLDELHSAYRDSIFEQDRSIAACIRTFLAAVGSSPYVIFFTSDHGEAFGEHAAIHHGQNLYEEQVHVPAWIAAGGGALDESQRAALESYGDAFVTHLDVLPTLLDVSGVLNHVAMEPYRRFFAGRSLVAARRPLPGPVPVTNCTAMFPCPLNTWGVIDERYELLAQAWDGDWRCQRHDGTALLPQEPACVHLRRASRAYFERRPNGASNR